MSTRDVRSLAALLLESAPEAASHLELRRQVRRLLAPLLVAGVLGLSWSGLAPLSGAVVAPAEVKVELNRKTVQHAEGGIVSEILVRDGQSVRAGSAGLSRVAWCSSPRIG
jgi:HlyD family secretion protein